MGIITLAVFIVGLLITSGLAFIMLKTNRSLFSSETPISYEQIKMAKKRMDEYKQMELAQNGTDKIRALLKRVSKW